MPAQHKDYLPPVGAEEFFDAPRLLEPAVRVELHHYLAGILRDENSSALIINSVWDHVWD